MFINRRNTLLMSFKSPDVRRIIACFAALVLLSCGINRPAVATGTHPVHTSEAGILLFPSVEISNPSNNDWFWRDEQILLSVDTMPFVVGIEYSARNTDTGEITVIGTSHQAPTFPIVWTSTSLRQSGSYELTAKAYYCSQSTDASVLSSPVTISITDGNTVVQVDNGDSDRDGIPDYADGFNLCPEVLDDDLSNGTEFFPVTFAVPDSINLSNVEFEFEYDASDPLGVQATIDEPYSLPPGSLRLWTTDGGLARNPLSLVDGGNYIAPYNTYAPSELGLSESNRVVTLYVEAVRESDQVADKSIAINYISDSTLYNLETVHMTAVRMQLLAKGEDEEDFTEVDGLVATCLPQPNVIGEDGAPGANQSYQIKIIDPRPGFSTISVDGQDIAITQTGNAYVTSNEFIGLYPDDQSILQENITYTLTASPRPEYSFWYYPNVYPDDYSATPQSWALLEEGTPVVEIVDGILDVDTTNGNHTYKVWTSSPTCWKPEKDTELQVVFKLLDFDAQGADGVFKLIIADGQNQWNIGIRPDGLVTYPNGARTEHVFPSSIGNQGYLIDGNYHVLFFRKLAGSNVASIYLTGENDLDIFQIDEIGWPAYGNFGLAWGDTGSDIQGRFQIDNIGWTHSDAHVEQDFYSVSPSEIVGNRSVVECSGNDVIVGYDLEPDSDPQLMSASSAPINKSGFAHAPCFWTPYAYEDNGYVGWPSILQDQQVSLFGSWKPGISPYRKFWSIRSWLKPKKPKDPMQLLALLVNHICDEMVQQGWRSPNLADNGAFGKEVHKRVSAYLKREKGWYSNIIVRKSNLTVRDFDWSAAFHPNGTVEVDVVYCKNGYAPQINQKMDPDKIILFEVKSSVKGDLTINQKEWLPKIASGSLESTGDVWCATSKYTCNSNGTIIPRPAGGKVQLVCRALEIIGIGASAWAILHNEAYDDELQEMANTINQVKLYKQQHDYVQMRAEAMIAVMKMKQYLSHYVPDDQALNVVTVGTIYKIIRDS
ncbi:MAG: hypothetical protein ACYC64_09240 [Armatimonadota bacterium]